jgi:hypothetical protein
MGLASSAFLIRGDREGFTIPSYREGESGENAISINRPLIYLKFAVGKRAVMSDS